MIETKGVQATPKNDKVITPEFNYGVNSDGTTYGTIYVRENIKQIKANTWQYDEKQYTFEEYVKILNEELIKANETINEQNLMIIDNTYRVTMIELAQQGVSL